MYRLRLTKRAAKDLDKLPGHAWSRAQAHIQALRQDPRPRGCVKIEGEDTVYRIRIGEYRALYDVDDKTRTVLVLRVQHRKDVYRDL